jgi:hypothetical protein
VAHLQPLAVLFEDAGEAQPPRADRLLALAVAERDAVFRREHLKPDPLVGRSGRDADAGQRGCEQEPGHW